MTYSVPIGHDLSGGSTPLGIQPGLLLGRPDPLHDEHGELVEDIHDGRVQPWMDANQPMNVTSGGRHASSVPLPQTPPLQQLIEFQLDAVKSLRGVLLL